MLVGSGVVVARKPAAGPRLIPVISSSPPGETLLGAGCRVTALTAPRWFRTGAVGACAQLIAAHPIAIANRKFPIINSNPGRRNRFRYNGVLHECQ